MGPNPLPSGDSQVIPLEVKALQQFLQRNPWAGLARNSSELHELVASDRLAIVLGAELDTPAAVLGVRNWNGTLAEARVVLAKNLQRLYDLGVRHLFGIHLVDSDFGGSALYSSMFDYNNYWLRKRWFNISNGWEMGARFRMDLDKQTSEFLLRILNRMPKAPFPQLKPPYSTING